jgi:small-conductance mechanosensitive channel
VASDLHVAINEELKEAGITIPFPQRDMHMYPAVPVDEDGLISPSESIQGSD